MQRPQPEEHTPFWSPQCGAAKNIAAFVKARGGEQVVYFWNAISKTQKLHNIQALHKELGQEVVRIVREARGLSK